MDRACCGEKELVKLQVAQVIECEVLVISISMPFRYEYVRVFVCTMNHACLKSGAIQALILYLLSC